MGTFEYTGFYDLLADSLFNKIPMSIIDMLELLQYQLSSVLSQPPIV